jgi:cytochrome c-type biogenesis protein CcmH
VRGPAHRRRASLPGIVVALAAILTLSTPSARALAAGSSPRPSLPTIERQVMCVTCKIPLNVAESPQAQRERAFIRGLIDQGQREPQIKRALVAQYGPTVLGLPGTHGFDLTAYLVPIAVVLALLLMLALLLPRWRRHARAQAGGRATATALSAADAARLDSDLARFEP